MGELLMREAISLVMRTKTMLERVRRLMLGPMRVLMLKRERPLLERDRDTEDGIWRSSRTPDAFRRT